MKFYSDFRARRARQITWDVIALVAIAAWVWLGVIVYKLVYGLTDFGIQMEEAGAGFRQTMTDLSTDLGNVPLIGTGIRAPFDGASDAGASLESAGQAQQDAVQNLATGLGVGIAMLPILMILLVWLVPRIRFARRAGTARSLVRGGANVDLLALRALATQRLSNLAPISDDPMAAWRRGDAEVVRALAALELRSAGVRID